MVRRKRTFQIIGSILAVVLLISLILNYNNYKKVRREEDYVQLMYNQFIFYVSKAAYELGSLNNHLDYPRASADTASAASELKALYQYEVEVQSNGVPSQNSTPHAGEIANFLSFVSLSLINENSVYDTPQGSYTVNRQTGEKIILEVNKILTKNMDNSTTIPTARVGTVFNEIYNLIPNSFKTDHTVLDFWQL